MRLGRYKLTRRLAVGGMGEVYLGLLEGAEGFELPVCVKCVRPELARDPRVVEAFLGEARAAALIAHENAVRVYDFGREGETYYLAMEWVDGADLRALLAGGRPPVPVTVAIGDGLLRALGAAHRRVAPAGGGAGLVHRDVSPHNVLLSREGAVKLGDFGLAAVEAAFGGGVHGKAAYLAPEQARGAAVDGRADLFGAGLVLWECLGGAALREAGAPLEVALERAAREALGERVRAEAARWRGAGGAAGAGVGAAAGAGPGAREAALAEVCARALELEPGARFVDADTMRAAWLEAAGGAAGRADADALGVWVRARLGEDGGGDAAREGAGAMRAEVTRTLAGARLSGPEVVQAALRTLAGARAAGGGAGAGTGTGAERGAEAGASSVERDVAVPRGVEAGIERAGHVAEAGAPDLRTPELADSRQAPATELRGPASSDEDGPPDARGGGVAAVVDAGPPTAAAPRSRPPRERAQGPVPRVEPGRSVWPMVFGLSAALIGVWSVRARLSTKPAASRAPLAAPGGAGAGDAAERDTVRFAVGPSGARGTGAAPGRASSVGDGAAGRAPWEPRRSGAGVPEAAAREPQRAGASGPQGAPRELEPAGAVGREDARPGPVRPGADGSTDSLPGAERRDAVAPSGSAPRTAGTAASLDRARAHGEPDGAPGAPPAPIAPAAPAAAAPPPTSPPASDPSALLWLRLDGVPGAALQLDAVPRGVLPSERILLDDTPRVARVQLPGGMILVRLERAGRDGRLQVAIDARPWAQLSVDGEPEEPTPRRPTALDPGRHRLAVRWGASDAVVLLLEVGSEKR